MSPPNQTAAYAAKICAEAREAVDMVKAASNSVGAVTSQVKWKAPSDGWLKINVDAGQAGGGLSGLGVVCRDTEGSILSCAAVQIRANWETPIAEARAVLEGVVMAKSLGLQKVIIESDCQRVVQALQKQEKGSSSFNLIIDDIFSVIPSSLQVVWSFVKRVGNRVAHELAHMQPLEIGSRMWEEDFSYSIVKLALDDLI